MNSDHTELTASADETVLVEVPVLADETVLADVMRHLAGELSEEDAERLVEELDRSGRLALLSDCVRLRDALCPAEDVAAASDLAATNDVAARKRPEVSRRRLAGLYGRIAVQAAIWLVAIGFLLSGPVKRVVRLMSSDTPAQQPPAAADAEPSGVKDAESVGDVDVWLADGADVFEMFDNGLAESPFDVGSGDAATGDRLGVGTSGDDVPDWILAAVDDEAEWDGGVTTEPSGEDVSPGGLRPENMETL